MKKVFIATICFLLLFTNISFANTINISDSVKDIDMVSNRMYIIIKQITGDDPLDVDELNRDIKFCESILSTRGKKLSDIYSKNPTVEVSRNCAALLYTISLYEIGLTSIRMYIRDDSKAEYFIEACASYQEGRASLNVFKHKYRNYPTTQAKPKKEKFLCH